MKTCLEVQKVSDLRFSHFIAPFPVINDQSLSHWHIVTREGGGAFHRHCLVMLVLLVFRVAFGHTTQIDLRLVPIDL